jgi:hypothetical protein
MPCHAPPSAEASAAVIRNSINAVESGEEETAVIQRPSLKLAMPRQRRVSKRHFTVYRRGIEGQRCLREFARDN